MVLIFALLNLFVVVASADCDLTREQLQELRTSLLCSCDDDTAACATLVDAFQRPSTGTLSKMIGSAIGTHLNYRTYSSYLPKGRLSQAGLNDWSSTAFQKCEWVEKKNLRDVLTKSIDEQIQIVNNDSKTCEAAKTLHDDFEEPHFVARCEGNHLIASPRKAQDTVEHTVMRGPASTSFTHILRSKGGETAASTRRAFQMKIDGKSEAIKYTLNFVDSNNEPLKPTVDETKHVRGLWQRYRREFVEMTNCCSSPAELKSQCSKYDISF